jgi:outer membrane receptor protein involved in Fe transport
MHIKEGKDLFSERRMRRKPNFKKHPKRALILTGFALVAGSLPSQVSSAQAATALEHLTIEEIVVTDSAITDNTTVVGSKTIEKGKNSQIPDAIKDETDITLSRRASIGDTADTVAIRGLSSNRIMLNINDRPVNAAGVVGGYYIDWGTIPLDNIEKIEIIRGGSSALYGNNNLGGVINVITKTPTEKPETTIYGNVASGSGLDLAQNYRFTHSYKPGIFGYSLAGSYQKSEEFLWNNDFEGKNLNIGTSLDLPWKGNLSLGMQYANSLRGYMMNNRKSQDPDSPGFNTAINSNYPLAFGETIAPGWGKAFTPGPESNCDKTKYYLDLGYKQAIGNTMTEFKIFKNFEDRDEKNYSLAGLVPGYGNGKLVLDRTVESDRSYGSSLKTTIPLDQHEVVAGLDYKVLSYGNILVNYVDTVYNGQAYTGGTPSQEGDMVGYFLQDTWKISERFVLTPGLRYDTYQLKPIHDSKLDELNDDTLSPKLTGTFGITKDDKVTASIYQAVRTPGLPEMWWWANGMTKGDPTLEPEKNNAAELIYQHDFSKIGQMRISTYYYDIEDYIIFRFDPSWRAVYNIDNAKIYGASIEQRMNLTDWMSGRASLTYQKSKKEGDSFDTEHLSDEIDYLPEWKATLGGEFKLPYKTTLNTDFHYIGDRSAIYAYTSSGKTGKKLVELDSNLTCDLNLKIPVSEKGEASLYVENLFNTTYEERFGYPLPGRIIGMAFKWNF